jgi:hypothetical protein
MGERGRRHALAALPPGKTRYQLYEAGWAPGPVWTGAENLARSHNTVSVDTIFHLLVRTTSAKLSVIVRSPYWSSKLLLLLLLLLLSMLSPNSKLRLKFHRSHLTVLKAPGVLF